MPYSDNSNVDWIIDNINKIQPKLILDIGVGAGKYGKLVKSVAPECKLYGIEVWQPYVEEFNLLSIYDSIFVEDAREFDLSTNTVYDVIFLGDILEHMNELDAISLWEKSLKSSRYVLMSIPTIHYPQGHEHGNPYEEHVVDNWSHELVIQKFKKIIDYKNFDITSSYLARGDQWK